MCRNGRERIERKEGWKDSCSGQSGKEKPFIMGREDFASVLKKGKIADIACFVGRLSFPVIFCGKQTDSDLNMDS